MNIINVVAVLGSWVNSAIKFCCFCCGTDYCYKRISNFEIIGKLKLWLLFYSVCVCACAHACVCVWFVFILVNIFQIEEYILNSYTMMDF